MSAPRPVALSAEQLGAFHDHNPEFELLDFDFHDPGATAALRWDGADRDHVLASVMGRQRVLRLTGSAELCGKLLTEGLHSAHQIAALSPARFVREHGRLFADECEAREVHRRAVATKAKTQHLWANVRDLVASRHYRATRFYNVQDDLTDYFQQIPSYQDLFGGLDYLACPHCRSILSPAAYFVDLMRVTDEYVTYPNTHKGLDNIPDGMRLEDRRPDLFTLPLNCENTDTVLPYLRIVNEVLEQKLRLDLGEEDVYPELALAAYPFNLPFTLPLQQVRANLVALRATLAQVYTALAGPLSAGLAQGGTADTVILAATADGRNGYYRDLRVALTEGPGAGQTRRITGYDGNTRTAAVAPAWETAPTAQTRYEVSDTVDVARESLGLSPEQYQVDTTPAAGDADVARLWGYSDLGTVLPAFTAGTGLISFDADSISVRGKDTRFDTELTVGDQLWCGEEIRTVAAIAGPDSLTVEAKWVEPATDAAYRIARWPKGAGSITVHRDSAQVTGVGADFESLTDGDQLQCAGKVRTIVEIRSTSELLVDSGWEVDATDASYTVNPVAQLSRMTTFLARTGLSRTELDALLRQDTSRAEFDSGVTQRFFVNATGDGLPPLDLVTDRGDPGNSFQRIVGLSVKRLDRLTRFIRLQRTLGWTAADTDWLLASIGATELDASAIEAMAATQKLTVAYGLPVDVVTAFWHNLKTIGRVDESHPMDLFDRIYNEPALLRGQNPYTSPTPIPFDPARPLDWDIDERTSGSTSATIRSRLLGALRISDDDLTRTARFVVALQGNPGHTLTLDLPALSWLHRLVRQASCARLTVDEYFTLLWFLFYPQQADPFAPPKDAVPLDIAATTRTMAAAEWLRGTPLSVYELRFAITGEQSAYVKRGFTTADLRGLIEGLAVSATESRVEPNSFVFSDIRADGSRLLFDALVALGIITAIGIVTDKPFGYTEIAGLLPVTEESFVSQNIDDTQSKEAFAALVAHDPPYVIAAQGAVTGILSAEFTDQTSLDFLFPDEPQRELMRAEVREVLLRIRRDIGNIGAVLAGATTAQDAQAEQGVADFLSVDREQLVAMLEFATGQGDLAAQRVALLTPLASTDEVPPAVVTVLTTLSRCATWSGPLGFTATELAGVAADPEPFGIVDTTTLTFADIQTLERFRRLTVALDDTDGALFEYFAKPLPDGIAVLAELTGWNTAQITLLQGIFWPDGGGRETRRRTVDGVDRLRVVFDLAGSTGTDAYFLADLLDLLHLSVGVVGGKPDLEAWAAYRARAGRTLDALSGRSGEDFAEANAQVSGESDTAKRDALVGFTIWALNKKFPFLRTPSDLYQFLLIDVEMSDCATTSRIAQGISSVQLYLRRCRMSLEPGVTELDVDPVWWEWLSAYRVWEANRKIFFYPENYLQPQLRSGQSPEFQRLTEALLQSDLNESMVSEAFLKYFDELDGLASLVPVASHNADVTETPGDDSATRLFVVARPRTDPYTYFWRTHDPVRSWAPWQKVDLSITSPEIAAGYAFGRLFLFWTELDTGKTSTIDNAAAVARFVRSAVLRYSFLAVSGQWVQPQILAATVPTELGPNDYSLLHNASVERALTPSGLYWRQPYPLRVARGLPGSGRLLVTEGLSNASGTGTLFRREVRAGDRISVGGQTRTVGIVVDDTTLAVTRPWRRSAGNAEYKVIPEKQDDNAFPPFEGTGTIMITEGLALVTGTGTRFTKQVSVGDRILAADEVRTVLLITSDTDLLASDAWTVSRTGESYVVVPSGTGTERLVVMFGAALSTANAIDPEPPKLPPNDGRDPFQQQLEEFDFDVYYSTKLAHAAASSSPGQVALNYTAVLDQDLLVADSRALVADYAYSASDNPRPYQYQVDRVERLLRAAQSDNAVAENYWGNSALGTPPPPKSTGESRSLLFNVSPGASIRNVGNQLGWSVFDNGDEAFLIRSDEPELDQLSNMVIGRPLADPQLGEALLLSASAYSEEPLAFDNLTFAVTRLTTSVVTRLRQRLFAGGIDRLLSLDSQLLPELPFSRFYRTPTDGPPPHVIPPLDHLDFDGAYGLYFREVFLFCPWLIADRLRGEQRFEDAKAWYEYIFNPTEQPSILDRHPHDRYWRYLPFREFTLNSLVVDLTDPAQIAAYDDEPFDPDAIARLRPAAYPKAVVLDYIDNLLQWADYLFAIDSSESINEATQLYVLASDLLGQRPTEVGVCPVPATQNFAQLRERYGQDIPQFLIDLENGVPALMNSPVAPRDVPINDIRAYFCVPENAELIGYWDRVEDRLFKIRHCMNLQGVVRELPLFEPPLDPNALIRARAAGGRGIPTSTTPPGRIPLYRFATLIERAKAFTANVSALGAALLSALEKQDAEQLALLRDSQEAAILDLTLRIKELQVRQAQDTGEALTVAKEAAATRRAHYRRLIDSKLSPEELQNLDAMEAGLVFNMLASVARTASSIAYTIPQIGSPFAITYGGIQVGSALAAGATVFEIGSIISQYRAQKSITMASYQRRAEDWQLQLSIAELDEESADAQIAANEVQRQIAERDVVLTRTSIAQNRDMRSFLVKKFTNEQLYQWMAGRLSEVYFQSWLLALDLARSAERAFQYELGSSRSFLDFAYWDGTRKGLLAGEGLMLALAQMEKAYLDGNQRTLEIEKTVSLAQIDPRALLNLKATGTCTFNLSERLFDFDFPGHFRRKLKTVTLTVPAVVGPYQNIHATLTQVANATVLRPDIEAIRYLLGSASKVPAPDALSSNIWVSQQVALSKGTNDSGLFQLDFNDPRFLPFEGTGAVSTWTLRMPPQTNRFDFSSISDVLVQVSYTAVDGGTVLRNQVVAQPELKEYLGSPLLSLAQLYSQDWYAFMTDHADPAAQRLRFAISAGIVPPHLERAQLVGFFFQLVTSGASAAAARPYIGFRVTGEEKVDFAPSAAGSYSYTFDEPVDMSEVFDGVRTIEFALADTPGPLKIDGFLDPAVVHNIALVLYYRATVNWSRIG
jgi:hypothetical protein